jgi:hypothetical protein
MSSEQTAQADMFGAHAERLAGWDYNEIVGWVRLVWDGPGSVIKGYLWQVGETQLGHHRARRRIARGFKPYPFVFGEVANNKVVEVWAASSDSNADLFARLRDQLLRITGRGGELPGRHVDLRIFDSLGPRLPWRALVGLE